MNLRSLAKSSLGIVSVALLTGCYTQSTVYRAVSDVTVTRPGDAGSAGPLVLMATKPGAVKAAAKPVDIGGVFDRMSLDQIGILEPHMGLLLRARHDADATLAELRSNPKSDPDRVKEAEAKSEAAHKQVDDYSHEWREMQRKLAQAGTSTPGMVTPSVGETTAEDREKAAASQTVLMASEKKSWGFFSSTSAHTMVLILDGPPKPGQYWLNADNSVLITSSAFSAPARNRVGLVGSIKILEVHGNQIVADVAIRETTESDSSEFISHLYDQAYYQTAWLLSGKHTFQVTNPTDPVFEAAAVHWVAE